MNLRLVAAWIIAGWSGTQSALLRAEDYRGDFRLSGFSMKQICVSRGFKFKLAARRMLFICAILLPRSF